LSQRRTLNAEARALREKFPGNAYVGFHAMRFATLLQLLDKHVRPGMVVLDIGRSALTEMVHDRFHVRVDSLGFTGDEPTPEGRSWWFDLNLAQDEKKWRTDLPEYDVVIMGEVIEHLHTAPRLVLSFLRTLLKPDGRLIIQTPNAAVLHKRLELLAGRNPYELIREQTNDPGHFREYTRKELERAVRAAGLEVEQWFAADYLDYSRKAAGKNRPRLGKVVNAVYRYSPPSLRPGQTLVARRPG
jgi:SAM-dependent methyltransferase